MRKIVLITVLTLTLAGCWGGPKAADTTEEDKVASGELVELAPNEEGDAELTPEERAAITSAASSYKSDSENSIEYIESGDERNCDKLNNPGEVGACKFEIRMRAAIESGEQSSCDQFNGLDKERCLSNF